MINNKYYTSTLKANYGEGLFVLISTNDEYCYSFPYTWPFPTAVRRYYTIGVEKQVPVYITLVNRTYIDFGETRLILNSIYVC